jgi:hypothetical protein
MSERAKYVKWATNNKRAVMDERKRSVSLLGHSFARSEMRRTNCTKSFLARARIILRGANPKGQLFVIRDKKGLNKIVEPKTSNSRDFTRLRSVQLKQLANANQASA